MKRSVTRSLICMFLVLILGVGAHGLSIPASEDTTATDKKITLAASTSENLAVDPTHVALVYFNLDDIPKDTVVRFARLRLYMPSIKARGAGLGVHRVTSQWNESAESAQPSYTDMTIAKIDGLSLGSRRFVTVDVTGVVQSWIRMAFINEGFALTSLATGNRNIAAASVTIAAKEGAGLGLPAQLDIELASGGTQGAQGPAGPAGAQGPKGDKGANGAPGPVGPQGPIGLTGPKGEAGAVGGQGSKGATGVAGPTGPQGPIGLTGAQGPKGDTGAIGAVGLQGPIGLTGPQGVKGDAGATGPVGPQGPQGLTGGALTISQLPTELLNFLTPSVSVTFDTVNNKLQGTVNGLGTLSYQWLRDNSEVANATTSQLVVTMLSSGSYALRVSNGVASRVSNAVYFSSPTINMGMASVLGGTLPSGSALAGQTVANFKIGKTEVTYGEWKAVQSWALLNGYSDLFTNVGVGGGEYYPVMGVTWYMVVKWCNARSEKEGLEPVYYTDENQTVVYRSGDVALTNTMVRWSANGYRLPTEAEWEWAARGGSQTHGYTYSGSNDLNAVGWYYDNSPSTTTMAAGSKPIGTKAANELGIYDMTGNVEEWCWDLVPNTSSRRIRGGSWIYGGGSYSVDRLMISYRSSFPATNRTMNTLGFRLACSSG